MEKKEGMINLILGGSGYGKSYYVLEKIIDDSIKNPDKNYIVVVPEQFTMATQKEIVARHPNHGVLNIDIVSFNRLAFRVFEELGINNLLVLDDTGKTLILKRVIEENKDGLAVYKSKVNQSGFVEEMKSAISEMYSYGVDLDKMDEITQKAVEKPYIADKLKDIYVIYKEFKKALGEKYIIKEEILDKLCNVAGKSSIVKNSTFIFDGFTGFTPIQYKLISVLLECGSELWTTVTMPAGEAKKITSAGFKEIKEQELFNMSKTTVNKLFNVAAQNHISIGKENIIIMPEDGNYRHRHNDELGFLEKNLFKGDHNRYTSDGKIKILPMDNPLKEADFAASYINNAVRNEGFRYRDFAVITGNLDIYRKPVITSFMENNIPYFADNKRKLILNPCVRGIRAAIEMVGEDFTYESIFKFFRCDISPIEREKTDILENYVLEYGIRGYRSYEKPFKKIKSAGCKKELEVANEIRMEFTALISDFRNAVIGGKKTVKEYSMAVYELMERLELYDRLKEYENKFNQEGRLDLGKEYSQTYGQIIGLLDKMVELMGDTVIGIKEYGKLLDAGFEEIKVGVIPLKADCVVIGDIQRTRLTDIKVLFVMGVNDGIIPSVGVNSGLLNQRDRGYLRKLNVELSPTSRESIFIQRFYLYQNLTKPTDRLILTYSTSSSQGKSERPSYLVGNILNMFTNVEKIAENSIKINVFTEQMGLKYLSDHFVNRDSEMTELSKELYTYFYKDNTLREKLMSIVEGAYFNSNVGNLDSAIAKALYGEQVVKSATRLEKYAACAYAHFLAYGLQLAERKIYEINIGDVGTAYHRVIELFSKYMKEEGYNFRTITDGDRDRILNNCIENIGDSQFGKIFKDSDRSKYLLDRIKDVSSRTIWAISEHIKAGNFEPEDFEMSFSDGRIDRVDSMEIDDRYFVKIIDYKTSNKKFDMEEVMNGLQLQLIYYMGAVMDLEKEKRKDSTVMPAGAFYFNIKSPYIDRMYEYGQGDDSDKYKEAMLAEYKMSGLINSDNEVAHNMDINFLNGIKESNIVPLKAKDINIGMGKSSMGSINFTRLIEYIKNKTEKMCDEILEGNIQLNPYKKGSTAPCNYCSYKGLCTFNEKYLSNKYRKLNKFEPEDIFSELGGEKHGNEVD